jgi:hypothetical protein
MRARLAALRMDVLIVVVELSMLNGHRLFPVVVECESVDRSGRPFPRTVDRRPCRNGLRTSSRARTPTRRRSVRRLTGPDMRAEQRSAISSRLMRSFIRRATFRERGVDRQMTPLQPHSDMTQIDRMDSASRQVDRHDRRRRTAAEQDALWLSDALDQFVVLAPCVVRSQRISVTSDADLISVGVSDFPDPRTSVTRRPRQSDSTWS